MCIRLVRWTRLRSRAPKQFLPPPQSSPARGGGSKKALAALAFPSVPLLKKVEEKSMQGEVYANMDLLDDAGCSIPFPQRDIYVHQIGEVDEAA